LGAAFVLVALLPSVLLGILGVVQIRAQAQQESIKGSLAVVRVVGFGLDAVLQDARRVLEIAAADPALSEPAWEGELGPARAQLRRLTGRYPLLGDIYLLDPAGKPLAAALAREPARALEGFSPELADNYGGYVSEVYRAGPQGAPHIFLVVEVRAADLSKRGFLAASVDLSRLHAGLKGALAPSEGGEGLELLIVDQAGRPIYPQAAWEQDADALRRRNPAVDRVLSTLQEGYVIYTDERGEERLAVYKSMIDYNLYRGVRWGVVVSQPTSSAFGAAEIAARNSAWIAGALALAALGFGGALARWLGGPLGRLAQHAREVGRKGAEEADPPARELQERGDEIGGLARAMAGMMGDLREQRRLSEARHEALRRAERLSSVGYLAAGVAHEINNPLTSILGYGQFLLEDKDEGHPDRAGLELIASEAQRVREIVRGLLEMSRRQGEAEEVELGGLARRAMTLSKAGLRLEEERLVAEGPSEPVVVLGDRQGLLQVWMNLISNAVDALEEGGAPGGQVWVRWGVAQEGGAWLEVEDEGAGMSPEVKARIFEPFFTTKPTGKGTGLGMAILGRIVEEHRGKIEVHSELGRGSRFRVWVEGHEAMTQRDVADPVGDGGRR
jgi:signal transduction histidine kinase